MDVLLSLLVLERPGVRRVCLLFDGGFASEEYVSENFVNLIAEMFDSDGVCSCVKAKSKERECGMVLHGRINELTKFVCGLAIFAP